MKKNFTKFFKVALKQVRFESERNTEVSISVIREIYALLALPQHQNIVRLFDVVVGRKLRKIFLVMEFCDQVIGFFFVLHF